MRVQRSGLATRHDILEEEEGAARLSSGGLPDVQAVHLDFAYPEARQMNRWLPLVKWLLAIPHYVVLFFLGIAALVSIIVAWFAILFTGRYPRSLLSAERTLCQPCERPRDYSHH
jgi:hypothetical protein